MMKPGVARMAAKKFMRAIQPHLRGRWQAALRIRRQAGPPFCCQVEELVQRGAGHLESLFLHQVDRRGHLEQAGLALVVLYLSLLDRYDCQNLCKISK